MDQHYHPRRRRAGRIPLIRAKGASKAFGFQEEAARPAKALPRESAGALARGDLPRGKNPFLPTAKSVTN